MLTVMGMLAMEAGVMATVVIQLIKVTVEVAVVLVVVVVGKRMMVMALMM